MHVRYQLNWLPTHRALLAVPSRVLPVLRLCALALAADALALARAQLVDVLPVRRDARLVRRTALARRVTFGCEEERLKVTFLRPNSAWVA